MTSIYLNNTDKSNSYGRSGRVTRENYSFSKLFYRYKHKSTTDLGPQTIYVYKKYNSGFGRYLTLTPFGYYKKHGLLYEHVYFNEYEGTTPLLFVLFFKDDDGNPRHRYYKRSQFDSHIDRYFKRGIDNLTLYNNLMGEQQLLDELINENDLIDGFLTYQIDKKDDKNYNNGKIKVELVQNSHSGLLRYGFKVYKHEPRLEHNNKKACVLYNKNVLMDSKGMSIRRLQYIKYEYISVYWSNEVEEPLLIEIKDDNVVKYYFHKKGKDGLLYWELFDTISYNKQFTKLLANQKEIRTELTKDNNTNLLKLLNSLKSDLDKTLVFMIEKQHEYKGTDVKSLFVDRYKSRLINKDMPVTDKTYEIGTCISKYGFKVYVHDFSESVRGTQNDELVHMQFVMPETNTGKYVQLKLFKDNSTNVYRSKTRGDDKVYVYFYGNDPRPLMVRYNNDPYVPYGENTYFTSWVRVSGIEKFTCGTGAKNEELLIILTQVICFLNPVKLEQKSIPTDQITEEPNTENKEGQKYTVQTFNKKDVDIKVTYRNLNCYRVYKHEPVGTDDKGEGFRLGEVKYGDNSLTYSSYHPLTSVEVYYSLYDYEHKHPLLVTLEFKNDEGTYKEYYKQISKEMITWQKVDIEQNEIEATAHSIRRDIDVTYTEEDKIKTLFSPESCKENDSDNSTIIEASVGTVSAVGAASGIGFGVFKYYGSVLAFFRGLF